MPQFMIIALAGAGLWAGYKFLRREMTRVEATLRDADAALRRKRSEAPRVHLERDPETGIYKPKRG
jgi:hypothetical protein